MGLGHCACVAVSHPRARHVEAELCLLWAHVPAWGGPSWRVHRMLSGCEPLGTHKLEFEEASRSFYVPGTLSRSIPLFTISSAERDGALKA